MDDKQRAETCNDWVRYEAQYGGQYAHQITEQLKKIEDETEMKNLIVSLILSRYARFYTGKSKNGKQNRPTKETKLMLELIAEQNYSFKPVKQVSNELTDSVGYLVKHSGLFSILYKVEAVFGDGYAYALLEYLYWRWSEEYKPSDVVKNWVKKNENVNNDVLRYELEEFINEQTRTCHENGK